MENQDKNFIAKCLQGDGDAFGALVEKYLKPVFNFIYQFVKEKEAADDLAQETFFKAWKNLKRFESNKNFKTWIYTIAKNTVYDHFKKKKAVPFSAFLDERGNNKLENIAEDDILPDELLIREDAAHVIEKKLKELPEHYRLILNLHYQEDFSLVEISEILKIPYNTVKSQHQRGLKELKKSFT